MAVIAVKSDYIYKANLAYSNLKNHEHIFEHMANAISYAKCVLLRNEDLDDFYINGTSVSVFQRNDGYALCFEGYELDIDVYDKQIIDIKLHR